MRDKKTYKISNSNNMRTNAIWNMIGYVLGLPTVRLLIFNVSLC